MIMQETPPLATAKQLAAYLGVSQITVRRWERDGTIPRGTRIGKRSVRWTLAAVEQYLHSPRFEKR